MMSWLNTTFVIARSEATKQSRGIQLSAEGLLPPSLKLRRTYRRGAPRNDRGSPVEILKKLLLLNLCLFFLLITSKANAGGAIQTDLNGLPLLWDIQQGLLYHPENGALNGDPDRGTTYNQEVTLSLLNDAFQHWRGVGTDLLIQQDGFLPDKGLPDGVDQGNFSQFLGIGTEDCYPEILGGNPANCVSPIIFDEDGEIIDTLFGQCAKFSILGFAGFDDVDDGSGDPARRIVRRGQALFSGACLPSPEVKAGCGTCQRVLTDQEIRTIVTHEVGHMLGMDHSQVNPEAFAECNLNVGGCPPSVASAFPMMFPILVNGAQRSQLHRDDEAYFDRLYGRPQENFCSVSGTVFASDGVTEVRGVEVVARNIQPAQELSDALSFISGAEAPKLSPISRSQGNCSSQCGFYLITGLMPGETYQLCVQKINPQFTGGSSIEPVDPPFQAFSNDCPEGLTVTCECEAGTECPEMVGVNISTDADPSDIEIGVEEPELIGSGPNNSASGGCSLAKPRRISPWSLLREKLLAIFFLGL